MVLDLLLEQIGDLPLDVGAEVLVPRTIVAGSLSDDRSHMKIVTGKQHFHPSN